VPRPVREALQRQEGEGEEHLALRVSLTPCEAQVMRNILASYQARERRPKPPMPFECRRLSYKILGTASSTNTSDPFEKERVENAAKREQRGQDNEAVNGRGGRGTSRGRFTNKSVRFASPPEQQPKQSATLESSRSTNPAFGPPSIGASNSQKPFNPFAQAPNPFGTATTNPTTNGTSPNPFGGSAQSNPPPSNLFDAPSTVNSTIPNPFAGSSSANVSLSNPFGAITTTSGTQPTSIFGTSSSLGSSSQSNPFGGAAQTNFRAANPFAIPNPPVGAQATSIFGTSSTLNFNKTQPNPFGINATFPGPKLGGSVTPTLSGSASSSKTTNTFQKDSSMQKMRTTTSGLGGSSTGRYSGVKSPFAAPQDSTNDSKSKLAVEIENLLRKNRINPPPWPTQSPGDPNQKGSMEAFWQSYKAYRAKARDCLIRNGYIDDPEKPKKLSEAIDFKGTCEDMCPEFEKITRIVEHDVKDGEKELSPDGKTYWPSPQKMIKKLARSAAGQDAPLPEDVRSPGALRRTLDYLIDTVLGENDLAKTHGFLWDRTRAIRRDFVFQQAAMNSEELGDQIYCLELITRFHVTALHQMSRDDVVAEDFSEQQELEQLGKALLSLIHAYEDSAAQGRHCENESEFRAYYVLFNSHNTGILEAVQDWGYKYWGESEEVRTAVSLVETLQNTWDTQGPLKPELATDIAQNAYHRFFSIVEDCKVSYTMACFAEIHFNKVRKAALKTILAGYRKQRDQTRDWSLDKLNAYLRFDDEEEIVVFGEAYGLNFETFDGQDYLSFNSDDSMTDPFPPLKQTHSDGIVERKRGQHTLPEVIHRTVYEEPAEAEDNQSLFIPPSPSEVERDKSTMTRSPISDTSSDTSEKPHIEVDPFPPSNKPITFDQQRKESISTTNDPIQGIQPTSPFTSQNSFQMDRSGEMAGSSTPEPEGKGAKDPVATSIIDKQGTPKGGIFDFLNKGTSTPPSTPPGNPLFPLTQATPPSKPSDFISSTASTIVPPTTVVTGPPMPPQLAPPTISPKPTTDPAAPGAATTKESSPRLVQTQKSQKRPSSSGGGLTSQNANGFPSDHGSITSIAPVVVSKPTESGMPAFANWIATGKGGLIDQFIEFTVDNIVRQTVGDYLAAERKRREEEEDKLSREEAARYREWFLATKYCHKWRDLAHRLWMRRKGRLARQARREMAEKSLRTSRSTEKKDVVKVFRASRDSAKRQSLEQMLAATGVLRGVHGLDNEIRNLVNVSDKHSPKMAEKTPKRPQRTARLTNGQGSTTSDSSYDHSSDALRRSLLSDSAYLQGGSRIHLMSSYSPKSMSHHQVNGVQTDYFRLKARGIATLPNGTPLANTAAFSLVRRKRSYDLNKPTTPERASSRPIAKSVPAKPIGREMIIPKTSAEQDKEMEAMKARAKSIMAEDKEKKEQSKKRLFDDDDEELLAKAKRIREQMDEGIEWFREEMQKSFSRSAS
jgi:nuclear mRNA export protein SAC3